MKNRKGLACDMMYTFVTYTSLVPDITNFKTDRGGGSNMGGEGQRPSHAKHLHATYLRQGVMAPAICSVSIADALATDGYVLNGIEVLKQRQQFR